MEYRIGVGYDIHRLVTGRKLFIAGIEIPYIKGLLGHSDADVLIHAVCDALLGALGSQDIGEHFPDTDPKYQDIPSVELLKAVAELVRKDGYRVQNIDTVVILEEPLLSPFKKHMQEKLSGILNIDPKCIGIKAKTNEGLDEVGRKQAIACYAAVMLEGGIK